MALCALVVPLILVGDGVKVVSDGGTPIHSGDSPRQPIRAASAEAAAPSDWATPARSAKPILLAELPDLEEFEASLPLRVRACCVPSHA